MSNPFEAAARKAKVDAILKLIPKGRTFEENELIADGLALMGKTARDAYARIAKVRPSRDMQTWNAVVAAVRGRRFVIATNDNETREPQAAQGGC